MPAHPLTEPLLAGNRRALARAITLAESSRPDHIRQAQQLLSEVMSATGNSIRLGLTGSPGVGKSTFIEAFGVMLADSGKRVAVLAVDPTSQRTGGSIMGDKTRMPQLTVHPHAFIRPSPSGTALGGVARRTRESMLLCEAAGYNLILVETVGVGQSETQVAAMTDVFVLLMLPNAGDELQGIKRGIMELADLCVVNKADSDPPAARRAQSQLSAALHLLTPKSAGWQPRALQASALTGAGLSEVWATIQARLADPTQTATHRVQQTQAWFDELLRQAVWQAFVTGKQAQGLPDLRLQVLSGALTPVQAVTQLLNS